MPGLLKTLLSDSWALLPGSSPRHVCVYFQHSAWVGPGATGVSHTLGKRIDTRSLS